MSTRKTTTASDSGAATETASSAESAAAARPELVPVVAIGFNETNPDGSENRWEPGDLYEGPHRDKHLQPAPHRGPRLVMRPAKHEEN